MIIVHVHVISYSTVIKNEVQHKNTSTLYNNPTASYIELSYTIPNSQRLAVFLLDQSSYCVLSLCIHKSIQN